MKISVGIPVTRSEYLKIAIDSCLSQTYKDIELLIINNAKNEVIKKAIDATVSLFNDNRIKYYRNDCQIPIIENWNKVLSFATGDYFTLMSDDDKMHPQFLEKIYSLIEKYPSTDLFHARVAIIDATGNITKLSPLCPEYESQLDFIYHRVCGWRINFVSDFIVKTSALRAINGFYNLPYGWGSDDITWYLLSYNKVAYSSELLFFYRNHTNTTSNSKKIKERLNGLKIYKNAVMELVGRLQIKEQEDDKIKELILLSLNDQYQKNVLDLISRYFCGIKYFPKILIPVILMTVKKINKVRLK